MTNKQLVKISATLLSVMFCVGFYSGYTGTDLTGWIFIGNCASIVMNVWVLRRLWVCK